MQIHSRRILTILTVGIPVVAAMVLSACGTSWRTVSFGTESFSVAMPGVPEKKVKVVAIGDLLVQETALIVTHQDIVYGLAYMVWPDSFQSAYSSLTPTQKQMILEQFLRIVFEPAALSLSQLQVTSVESESLQLSQPNGQPLMGIEFIFDGRIPPLIEREDPNLVFLRFLIERAPELIEIEGQGLSVLSQDKLFLLVALHTPDLEDSSSVEAFLGSFDPGTFD